MKPEIFLAYDVRGKVGTELTPNVVERIGRAMAAWLPAEGAVAVGRDMRPDSADFAEAIAKGLRAGGRDVWDIGQVTSDMIYFAVGKHGLAGGAMITASHNPGDYNGIKLCREGARPIGIETGLAEIRDMAITNRFDAPQKPGEVVKKNVVDGWIEHALSFVDTSNWPKYKVVVDAGNGMAGAIVPHLDKKVPLQITPMYFELDGTFPNHIANPLEPKNLVDLQQKIKETHADFGIAFDGDGDRAVLVDEKGEALSGTVMTAIMATYFLEKYPGSTVLFNAICGRVVEKTVKAHGGHSYRTKVGHSFIKADMRTYDAVFAGEHSGHYYFKDNYNADSGLIAALVAIQALVKSGKKLSELADEYRKASVSIPETNFVVEDKDGVIKKVAAALTDGTQDMLDGLTVSYDYGWVNVRPSNTESLLRLNAEANTQEQLDKLVARATTLIKG